MNRLAGLLAAAASALSLCAVAQRACAAPPAAQSVSRGEQIAREICAACHETASDQEFPPLLQKPAPSFREIANRPGTSARSLAHFIDSTHWNYESIPMKMPNPMLSRADTSAVARYILSLREHGRGIP